MSDDVRDFYDELAERYQHIYADWDASARLHGEQLEALLRARAVAPPAAVFDAACGIGTQAIGLALRGYRVTGADLSSRAVERARREARRFGVSIDFGVADLRARDRALDGRFDALVCCDNALPHLLTDAELAAGCANFAAKLRAGGALVIGIRDYDALLAERPSATPVRSFGPRGARRAWFQLWNWAEDGASYELEHLMLEEHADGWRTTHARTHYRALRRVELERALSAAGFMELGWHEPAATGHHQPLLVARRG